MSPTVRGARYQLMRLARVAAEVTYDLTLVALLIQRGADQLHAQAVKAYRAAGEAWWSDGLQQATAEWEAERGQR